MLLKTFRVLLFFLVLTGYSSLMGRPREAKILLIPLDARPPCLQFTVKMGLIAGCQVITPPGDLLGNFTVAGNPEAITRWLMAQDLESYDAAIISLDMLAYGGLVASRIYNVDRDIAMKRIQIIHEIKKRAPMLPLYGQSVIMRLAPTSDGKNEGYRQQLSRWAEISPYPEYKTETTKLEHEIPTIALNNYRKARQRNLTLNLEALNLVDRGILDYLILSQDDAKVRGVHVADRENVVQEVKLRGLENKVAIQPGTDEVAMLLMARSLNRQHDFSPKVYVTYSSETAANMIMPFEDRPLHSTVTADIFAAGATETKEENDADLYLYVFASRFDKGDAAGFAAKIKEKARQGKKLMVADVDPKGNTQGGDSLFTNSLLEMNILPDLYGYASWNTAGNTIGTALPQGLLFYLAEERLFGRGNKKQLLRAQSWFTFHRVLDDYYFHSLVRPKANAYFRQINQSGFERPETAAKELENYSRDQLQIYFNALSFRWNATAFKNAFRPKNMRFSLPWNRTFEAEIDFD